MLPHGVDALYDVARHFPQLNGSSFIDVGANLGQTAKRMREYFPLADIHCLEPFAFTMERLRAETAQLGVHYHQIALSSSSERRTIRVDRNPVDLGKNSLLHSNDGPNAQLHEEEVQVETLQQFCESEQLQQIGVLKIDTEGLDLEVLKGGKQLLAEHAIAVVQIEVGFDARNDYHVPYAAALEFMHPHAYKLFGIYDQALEFHLPEQHLRRANLVFVSPRANAGALV